jgi:hypothetical protein
MTKLALAIAVLALGAGAFALLRGPAAGTAEGGERALDDAGRREVRTIAREEARLQAIDALKEADARLVRVDELRKQMEKGVEEVQRAAKAASEARAGDLDELEERIQTAADDVKKLFGAQGTEIAGVKEELEKVRTLAATAASRPPPGEAKPEPAAPAPVIPSQPPPALAGRDPEQVAKDVEQATANLDSPTLTTVFAAIEVLRRNRVVAAVPKLISVLVKHKEAFARGAAATALGDIASVEGIEPLAEALVDKDPMVAQQAGKALKMMTGYDLQISARAGIQERRQARTDFKEWWKEHEGEVRPRLVQPEGAPR